MGSIDIAETISVSGPEAAVSASSPGDAHRDSAEAAVELLEEVDAELVSSLAALHGAPDSVIAATITAYRFGTRSLLDSMGLLEEGEDKPGRLRISERGKQVIAASAARQPQSNTDVDAALEAASAALGHPGRADRLKVR